MALCALTKVLEEFWYRHRRGIKRMVQLCLYRRWCHRCQCQNRIRVFSQGQDRRCRPLLAIIALCVFAYFKLSRAKGKEKRRAWAEGVDKRMSTISTGWQSMSAAGAQAAIRNSMAVGDPRTSSFSFGAIRPPSSVYPAEGGQAGVDVYASPEMVQRSPGVGLRSSAHSNALAATRVSRVSFAESVNSRPHGRPSGESRRSAYERRSQAGTSRAFHTTPTSCLQCQKALQREPACLSAALSILPLVVST
ncbi:hypothetical protein VKT23_020750 [Stygiomarasmius scandens]|uniref:Transmembrane protein n=1 Tax=Marasmiellus scandens TaxID=2682957 RepID=A0ABR1IKS0_9AGAR